MGLARRVKRAIKELLGLSQWDDASRAKEAPYTLRSFEDQLYEALIAPGSTVFDIGANRGVVSQLCARLTGPSGQIYAFEPLWPVYELLCRNLRTVPKHAGSVVAVPYALGDREGSAIFTVPSDDLAMASLAPANNWRQVTNAATVRNYHGSIIRLDDFLSTRQVRMPDFMKIDVEGAELFVLRGAKSLFASGARPAMLIEIFAPWEKAFEYGPWDVLSLLGSYGYQFFFACRDGLIAHNPTPTSPFPVGYETGYNVVAVVPDIHKDALVRLSHYLAGKGTTILEMQPPPIPNTIS
jgi:FkbM family methyltransferase